MTRYAPMIVLRDVAVPWTIPAAPVTRLYRVAVRVAVLSAVWRLLTRPARPAGWRTYGPIVLTRRSVDLIVMEARS